MINKYMDVLDCFDTNNYISTRSMKNELKESNHIEAINILKKYNIAQPYDYLRACGTHGFTDFALNKLKKITQDDSKYIISREIKGKNVYLYCDNLIEKVEEMNWLVSKGYFNSIKSKTNKIKGHFKNENELVIGKKSTGEIKIQLEKADINSIVTRKYYLFDKNHLAIQAQLAALGPYFGFSSKLARNDKNKEISNVNLQSICTATMKDLDLQNMKSRKSFEKIDYVDVVWIDVKEKLLTVAIEVEFKEDWGDAIGRLLSLSSASKNPKAVINIIVSQKLEDYYSIEEYANWDIFYNMSKKTNIAHLSIQELLNFLDLRKTLHNPRELREKFFKQLRFINQPSLHNNLLS